MTTESNTQFDTENGQFNEEAYWQHIEERRRKNAGKRRRKKFLTIVILIVAFALLATMCGKDIVRLKAENRALRKQQAALEKQRTELQEELKSTNDQEYIREQAKKQLKLLNPGEILFTFDEDDSDKAKETENSEDSGENKDGGSDG